MKQLARIANAKAGMNLQRVCCQLLALSLMLPCWGQNGQQGQTQTGVGGGGLGQTRMGNIPQTADPLDPLSDMDTVLAARRLRMINAERQKSMVSDSDKLLKLAAELNAEVSSSKPDALTPAQLRKVAEIEKLAHSIKQKMCFTMAAAPVFQQPASTGFPEHRF